MKQMVIKVESFEEMLRWSDELAQMIDSGKRIPESCIRSFEDPADLLALFTPVRRELLDEILRNPGSVNELAARVHRDPDLVTQDILLLADAEIVSFEDNVVKPIAESVIFEPFSCD